MLKQIFVSSCIGLFIGITATAIFFVSRGGNDSSGIAGGLDDSIDQSIEVSEGITIADATASEIVRAYIRSLETIGSLEELNKQSEGTNILLTASNRVFENGFEQLVRDIEKITSGNIVIKEEDRKAYLAIKRCITNTRRLSKAGIQE